MSSFDGQNLAFDHIASVMREEDTAPTVDINPTEALWRCLESICIHLKTPVHCPPSLETAQTILDGTNLFCEHNNLRFRTISLSDKKSLRSDMGPILCCYQNNDTPAVLIPKNGRCYQLIVPSQNINRKMLKKDADSLLNEAFMFYRTLPDETLTWKDLLAFSRKCMFPDLKHVFIFQGFVAFLSLFFPIATGIFFDNIVPTAALPTLAQLSIALIINALVISLFNISLVIATIRIRLKVSAHSQPAIWDRLLRLPLRFFGQYTTGDLADRVGVIDDIQQEITSAIFVTLISSLMSVITIGLLFYYSPELAAWSLVLITAVILYSIINYLKQLKYLRATHFFHGKLSGFTFQILNSIGKLKISNSLDKAFYKWSQIFTSKNKASYETGKLMVSITTATTFFSLFGTIILFTLVFAKGESLSFGRFIAFNAAFGQLFSAVFALITTFASILRIIPIYERVKPILEEKPERENAGYIHGTLIGKIEVNHLSFQYKKDLPMIFKDLSLSINPGENVVITGQSGIGKTTLLRLLLGFLVPDSGAIYYDNFDLTTLNLLDLRRQIGVVMQSTRLFPGTLLDNIYGTMPADEAQAWALLETVALKEDVAEMPMGLNTVITETGQTLSMGQCQRILLARALSKKPKILLLDEAMSALDQITEQQIATNLQKLQITCVHITHKTTAIQNTDKVIRIKNGEAP